MSAEHALRWAGTAAFLAVAGYFVARLVAAHRAQAGYPGCRRAIDTAQVLMGVGMAAMASPVGGPFPVAGWQAVFLVMTAWFVGSWWHDRCTGRTQDPGGRHGSGLHHAVAAVAMLYMLSAAPHDAGHHAEPWMSGHLVPGMALPVVGWALAGYFAVSALLLVTRTDWRPVPGSSILLAPRLIAAAQTTMTLGNGYLLVAMLAA